MISSRGYETGTGKELWHVRFTDGTTQDFYVSELLPLLQPEDSDSDPVQDAEIPAPDVLPGLSHLYRDRGDVGIKCLRPDAKSMKPRKHGQPSRSSLRFSKYKNATTIAESTSSSVALPLISSTTLLRRGDSLPSRILKWHAYIYSGSMKGEMYQYYTFIAPSIVPSRKFFNILLSCKPFSKLLITSRSHLMTS